MENWSDSELVKAINAGRKEALEVMFGRHFTAIVHCLRMRYRDRFDVAEDSAVNAFLKLGKGKCDPEKNPVAWLMTVAKYDFIDQQRRRKSESPMSNIVSGNDTAHVEFFNEIMNADEIMNVDPRIFPPAGPEFETERRELLALVMQCMDALQEDLRYAIFRRFIDGAKLREIADEEKVGIPAVFKRIEHGLAELRRCLASKGIESEDV